MAFAQALSTRSTILVFARDQLSGASVASGLQGYGIPFEIVIVPQSGITLPSLTTSDTSGNYGGFLILGEVSYGFDNGASFRSALTPAQFQQLFDYQTKFGVRMVRLDAFPGPEFGMFVNQGGLSRHMSLMLSPAWGIDSPAQNSTFKSPT